MEIAGPASGRMLPTLVLRGPQGEEVPLWRYRARCPLVILVHRGPTDLPWVRTFAARYADFHEAQAEVLAVGPEPLLGLPFPTLLDHGGRLAAALALQPPAIMVADRPGEVWAAWGDATLESLPDPDEVRSWLEYAMSECRECFCCELVWPAELMGR
ncbi:MAG: hypothetical protein HY690_15510 [Chloroflexi bacterium]|nr:hypothetical protein [Chloroflexota bacterium]